MSSTIVDHIRETARRHPDRTAIVEDEGPTLTYGELRDAVLTRARTLRQKNVQPAERCGLLADSGVDFVIQALGLLESGLCLVPIARRRWENRLSQLIERLQLHYLIRDDNDFTLQRLPSQPAEDGINEEAFRDLHPAYIRMTSGTTGRRKGVLLSHETICRRTKAVNRRLGIGPEDRVLWVLSMANHFVSSILLYLRFGATLLVTDNHLAEPLLDFARRHEATFLYATPYHYDRLAGEPSGRELSGVRRAISTATGLRRDIAERFLERYDQPLCQALGIIEAGLPAINLERPRDKPLSVGQTQPAYTVTLRDEDGICQPPSEAPVEAGEIMVSGPGLFDAYLDPWTPADQVLVDGSFPTGDQGRFDADGDLFVVGRRVNRINMAGMKFFCEEVESVINRHPAVEISRVYGEDHPKLREVPHAEFVPDDPEEPPDEDELQTYCREVLPPYQVPRSFKRVDAIPRTPTGKIKRGD